jgi:hypothetical protein
MKQLRDYLKEAEAWASGPVEGDQFAINIREECLLETSIHRVVRDGVILEADERFMELLAQYDMLGETIRRYGPAASNRGQGFTVQEDLDNPMAQAVLRRIMIQHPDWIGQYGAEFLMQVIDDVTEGEDWEEIGSSDVSAYVRMVHDQLRDRGGSREEMADRPAFSEDFDRIMELAGTKRIVDETAPIQPNPNAARTDPLAAKAADLAAVGTEKDPTTATTVDEGVMSEIDIDLQSLANRGDEEDLIAALEGDLGPGTAMVLQNMMEELKDELAAKGMTDVIRDDDKMIEILWDKIVDEYSGRDLDEAEYQGRKVKLGKPMQGDVKKFKVYVRDPKTGNVKKVNFGHGGKSAKRAGEKTLSIKKSNPARRRSFRARHNCDNPGPRTSARYWSCRMW